MEDVVIITRDINGVRESHYTTWDIVCSYIESQNFTEETQILAVIVEGSCVYSALVSPAITWDDVTGFFA